MGDANELMFAPEGLHLCSDSVRDFAADVGVDLVEHEKGNRVVRGECGFDRQHEPRNFAARSDCAQRLQRFAGVRREN